MREQVIDTFFFIYLYKYLYKYINWPAWLSVFTVERNNVFLSTMTLTFFTKKLPVDRISRYLAGSDDRHGELIRPGRARIGLSASEMFLFFVAHVLPLRNGCPLGSFQSNAQGGAQRDSSSIVFNKRF